MQYRKFGRLDWKPSALGFGCMRLPLLGTNEAEVDQTESIKMIRYGIDHGVNYVDTAYPYHSGNSERIVGLALKDGYRERVRLATKLPSWLIRSRDDFDRYFNEQLERLQTSRIDFYLLHGQNKDVWPRLRDLRVFDWAETMMAKGSIGHLGFSFHDEFELFKTIIDAWENWTFCQIQYNFMDIDYQAGTRGLKYAASKGLAVVVMEPLRGGRLSNPPKPVRKIYSTAPQQRSPSDWALQWVWNQPEVSVALSGMSAMSHVVENIASAERSGVGTLTARDLELIDKVRKAYLGLSAVPCTGCEYCMPCPNGVAIPRIFALYSQATMYGDAKMARQMYNNPRGLKEEQHADHCKECGECLPKCPQGFDIPQGLKEAHKLLSNKA